MSVTRNLLFSDSLVRPYEVPYPSTRFQGSKLGIVEWLWQNICDLQFDSVLDVFGGTGAVSHMFKTAGKQVVYNDYLAFNQQIGLALIENENIILTPQDVESILQERQDVVYPTMIQATFPNIYFTEDENIWLDRITYHIQHFLPNRFQRALAYFAVFQASIIKRPYNLFHRANLYMRQAEVTRSFGNKTTWDTPFEDHFRTFVQEANAAVFNNGRHNRALCFDALETPIGADLVYLDPPYMNAKGISVDYRDFYHFLEGLMQYDIWPTLIDQKSRHKRLCPQPTGWNRANTILGMFEALIARHRGSIIVLSYRADGIPSRTTLIELLKSYKSTVREVSQPTKYALAHRQSRELLLIGF